MVDATVLGTVFFGCAGSNPVTCTASPIIGAVAARRLLETGNVSSNLTWLCSVKPHTEPLKLWGPYMEIRRGWQLRSKESIME